MGILSSINSPNRKAVLNIPKRIDNKEDTIPDIILRDTRINLPTREEIFTMNKLMVAHNVDEYRRSKSAITLLPEVEIDFDKLLIDRDSLIKEDIVFNKQTRIL